MRPWRQDALGVLVVDLLQAALDERCRTEAEKLWRSPGAESCRPSPTMTDQHLVVAELEWAYGQAHAVFEAHEDGVESRPRLVSATLPGSPKSWQGPSDLVHGASAQPSTFSDEAYSEQDAGSPPGRVWRGHEDQQALAGEGGLGGGGGVGLQALHGGLEEGQVVGRW